MVSNQLIFERAILFSNKLVEMEENNLKNSLEKIIIFLNGFDAIYRNEKKKLPYHINIIDELRADENAHSRILAKLLMHREPVSLRYEILNSFIDFIIVKYNDKRDFRDIEIKKPQITIEERRIDLWIKEDKKYAIIIENKVHNADDQGCQLERYINTTKDYGYNEKNIFVLYLPPTYAKEPSIDSWGKYFNKDIYKRRYQKLSFKDDILPWLKSYVLPNVRVKERLLLSSLEQYIDHLEGRFSLRSINNKMNMKLQEFIKKELGLNNSAIEEALTTVSAKQKELTNALNQLGLLQESIKIEHFKKWQDNLSIEFPNLDIVSEWSESNTYNYVGVKIKEGDFSFSLITGYETIHKTIYFGIGTHFCVDKLKSNKLDFSEIVSDQGFDIDEGWYGYKNTSFQNAYLRLTTLIDKVVNKKQYQIRHISENVSV